MRLIEPLGVSAFLCKIPSRKPHYSIANPFRENMVSNGLPGLLETLPIRNLFSLEPIRVGDYGAVNSIGRVVAGYCFVVSMGSVFSGGVVPDDAFPWD